ncbi:MAG: hypothetical protein LBI95_03455 [Holosporales bacterium]|nr:hypothetical protein [Holosporales bacterium]
MKFISIIVGISFLSFANAEELNDGIAPENKLVEVSEIQNTDGAALVIEQEVDSSSTGSENTSEESAEDAVPTSTKSPTEKNIRKKRQSSESKASWWESILKFFKVSEEASRTCEQALAKMEKEKSISIDLSNTSDFEEKGDETMANYYAKLIETNAFGTHSKNLYINLAKTNASNACISKWMETFKKDGKIIVLNLSDNSNLGDDFLEALDFRLTYSINLANTEITDNGISKLISMLETNGIGKLVCINLSGTKVTEAGIESLKAAIQKAVEMWKTENPGKDYDLEGDNESGIIYNQIPNLEKVSTDQADSSPESLNNESSLSVIPEPNDESSPMPGELAADSIESSTNSTEKMGDSEGILPTEALNDVDTIIAEAQKDIVIPESTTTSESPAVE